MMTATRYELLGELEEEFLEGELEEEALEFESTLPAPPFDKDPVSGCTAPGKPFDDFAFRSPAVPAKHGPRIKELATIIVHSWVKKPNQAIRTVCLEGHTDDVGSDNFNMRLGLARAQNLRDALELAIFDEANKTGFGPQIFASVRIQVSSKGETKPVASNLGPTDALGRRRNRRVRFAFST
jgi:hypothetical protein